MRQRANHVATLDGHTVAFNRRARLATAALYEPFEGQGLGDLHRTEELTFFAVYRLPQVVHRLGVLRYAPPPGPRD